MAQIPAQSPARNASRRADRTPALAVALLAAAGLAQSDARPPTPPPVPTPDADDPRPASAAPSEPFQDPSALGEDLAPDTLRLLEGNAVPSQRVVVGAPFDAVLAELRVADGDFVPAGGVVAVMDDRVQAAVVASARLNAESTVRVRAAELALEEARREVDRMRQAVERGGANESELQRTVTQMHQAEVALEQAVEFRRSAAIELEVEEERLRQFRITAPFDALVVRVFAEQGESLQRAGEIALLAALDPLEVDIHLPTVAWRTLEVGRMYALRAARPVSADLPARLVYIDPVFEAASRKVRCRFEIDNPGQIYPAGFSVHLVSAEPIDAPADSAGPDGLVASISVETTVEDGVARTTVTASAEPPPAPARPIRAIPLPVAWSLLLLAEPEDASAVPAAPAAPAYPTDPARDPSTDEAPAPDRPATETPPARRTPGPIDPAAMDPWAAAQPASAASPPAFPPVTPATDP